MNIITLFKLLITLDLVCMITAVCQWFFNGWDYMTGLMLLLSAGSVAVTLVIYNRFYRPIKTVGNQVKSFGQGDLVSQITYHADDEIGHIATSLNHSIGKLKELITQVNGEAETLSHSSVELAANSEEAHRAVNMITRTMTELAAGAQDTGKVAESAALHTDKVAALAEDTAGKLQLLLKSAEAIKTAAQTGQTAVNESTATINQMAEMADKNSVLAEALGDKSKKVTDIVSMITNIANQTNLLALNAAIEAARAGEHGRGFAVVAEEVRKLAEQSGQAADQIQNIVEDMLHDIRLVIDAFKTATESMSSGVETIHQANNSFQDINLHIVETTSRTQDVAALAGNQAQAAEDLKATVHEVSAIAQQSVAATQTVVSATQQVSSSITDIATGSHSLSQLAGSLEQMVMRFKISDKIILRVAFGVTDKSPVYAGMKKFADLVAERTQGRYQVKIFHSSQLGNDLDIIQQLREGTLEIGLPIFAVLGNLDKKFMLFDFPFLFRNENIAEKVLKSNFGRNLLNMLDNYDLHGLTFAPIGFRELTNSVRPVAKMEDFQGLRIRTMQNPLHMDMFTMLGAKPEPMGFGKLYDALANKTIDGQENPISTIFSSNFYEVQKYLTLSQHVYSTYGMLYSKKLWDKLPAKDKAIIEQAAQEGADFISMESKKQDREMVSLLEQRGMQISHISDTELDKIQAVTKPVFEKYSATVGQENIKALLAEIKKY